MPKLDFAERADEALGTGDMFVNLWWEINEESHPPWFWPWVVHEQKATSIREFAPLAVPGLLQTEDYARALYQALRPTDNGTLEELVAARMERQTILARDEPPALRAVLDQAALIRPVGGASTMRDQLDHLADLSRHPKIVVQVVPLTTGAQAGVAAGFTIAGFSSAPDLAYADSGVGGRIVDSADEVAGFRELFDTLQAEALSRETSFKTIIDARGDLDDD